MTLPKRRNIISLVFTCLLIIFQLINVRFRKELKRVFGRGHMADDFITLIITTLVIITLF